MSEIQQLQELELEEAFDVWEQHFLEDDQDEDVGTTRERFQIHDLSTLSWAMRKLKALADQSTEIQETATAERKRIAEWESKELHKVERAASFFEMLLHDYVTRQRELDAKFKTASTPYGKVTLKKQQPAWNYDDAKLLEWLKANKPEFVRVKEEPNKVDFKKAVAVQSGKVVDPETGLVVEGVTVEERPDKLEIKVGE